MVIDRVFLSSLVDHGNNNVYDFSGFLFLKNGLGIIFLLSTQAFHLVFFQKKEFEMERQEVKVPGIELSIQTLCNMGLVKS